MLSPVRSRIPRGSKGVEAITLIAASALATIMFMLIFGLRCGLNADYAHNWLQSVAHQRADLSALAAFRNTLLIENWNPLGSRIVLALLKAHAA